jgi:DNA-directed RNA polymerase subunit RPC12/RpoP
MSEPTATDTTTPQSAADAWNNSHRVGTPVLHWPRGDRSEPGQVDVTVSCAFVVDASPEAIVRLGETWRHVPLAHVDAHPLAAKIAELSDADPDPLEFPPPACSACVTVDTYHDGDGFTCPQCGTRWSSNGYEGTRPCVECDNEAAVLGPDEQPRCRTCQVQILTGDEEATPPYDCRRCGHKTTGIGSSRTAYGRKVCGGCQQADDNRTAWDRLLTNRVPVSSEEATTAAGAVA